MRGWSIGLGSVLLAANAQAAGWRIATSDHFRIYSRDKPEALRAYAEKLERFDRTLRLNQAVVSRPSLPSDRLTIFALSSPAEVESVIGGRGSGIAGVYRGNVTGSIALTSRQDHAARGEVSTQIVLLHEYAHHFMLTNFPASYPAWFVEGYAEFVSTVRFEDNGDISLGLPAQHRGYELSGIDNVPMSRMLAGTLDTDALLEAKGWALTHYLTFEPSRKGQLQTYLSLIQKQTPLDAARAAFGSLTELDWQVHRYVARPNFPYVIVGAQSVPPGTVAVAEVSPGDAAMMPIIINSRFGVDQQEAKRRVAQARRLAAPYPAEPAVQCALAEAEDDADNAPATDAAADRLLALDPKSTCGMIFKGEAALTRGIAAKAPTADPVWTGARDWFVRANRAAPGDPWPMWLYYRSFKLAHATPTANATIALLAAQQLAPADDALRLSATIQLLRDRRPNDARAMLAPLIGNAHGKAAVIPTVYARIGEADPSALAGELEGPPPK